MKTNKKIFNVLLWEFNTDSLVYYDVLPYLREQYERRKERSKKDEEFSNYSGIPKTLEEFKKFIESESQYRFWARCEYEMICSGWPAQKNKYKLDVHEQIMMNIDVIAEILYNEITNKK